MKQDICSFKMKQDFEPKEKTRNCLQFVDINGMDHDVINFTYQNYRLDKNDNPNPTGQDSEIYLDIDNPKTGLASKLNFSIIILKNDNEIDKIIKSEDITI